MQRPIHSPQEQVRHLQSIGRLLRGVEDIQASVGTVLVDMDQGYAEVAASYGFSCHGCEESCCRTVFYHHTYAEFLILFEGLATLSGAEQRDLFTRAAAVQAILDTASADTSTQPRAMCPLNTAGRCTLYAFRPMICRLHGIPHELHRPDDRIISGPGCHLFETHCGGTLQRRLDRTPYYQHLAQAEQDLRRHIETPVRLHMTLAECLSALADVGDAADAAPPAKEKIK